MMETLSAGEYYVGDPCYVIDGDLWSKFCDSIRDFDICVFDFCGHKCFISSTNYGDGTYKDEDGRKYSVDAGIIGAIPISLVTKDYRNLGHSFFFGSDFKVGADEGRNLEEKRIYIGDIVIHT